MKNKSKVKFRIGAMCLIALFLLLPLLSSPVAAAHTVNLGSVTTNNTPTGPTATGTIGGVPATIFDTTPWNANYVVSYSYTDSYPVALGGSGSRHWMEVYVTWQPGGTGSWSSITHTQGAILIAAGAGTVANSWTTPWITGYGGKFTNFNVTVTVYCNDISSGSTASWTSNTIRYSIV